MLPHSRFIAKVDLKRFRGEAVWDGDAVCVVVSGTADFTARDGLRFLFAEAQAAAKAWGAARAIMNLRATEFMNSSCISAILGWANAVAAEHEDERYPITLLWDPRVGWEKRSMAAIQAVAQDIVVLDPPLDDVR